MPALDGKWPERTICAAGVVVVCAWIFFSFISPPAPIDRWPRVLCATGVLALLIAVVTLIATRRAAVRGELLWWTMTLSVLIASATATVGRTADELAGIGTFVGAIGLLMGALNYFRERHDAKVKEAVSERQRRHGHMMTEWAGFVADRRLVRAIYMLETNDPDLKKLGHWMPFDEYKSWKNGLDTIFEFLLRSAFAVRMGELTDGDVREAVGWYFEMAAKNEHVRTYCENHGYAPVIEFARSRAAFL